MDCDAAYPGRSVAHPHHRSDPEELEQLHPEYRAITPADQILSGNRVEQLPHLVALEYGGLALSDNQRQSTGASTRGFRGT